MAKPAKAQQKRLGVGVRGQANDWPPGAPLMRLAFGMTRKDLTPWNGACGRFIKRVSTCAEHF